MGGGKGYSLLEEYLWFASNSHFTISFSVSSQNRKAVLHTDARAQPLLPPSSSLLPPPPLLCPGLTNLGLFGLHDGEQLLGYDREHLDVDAVELIEAAPGTRLS